jgi:L-fuconolactonase
MTIDSRRTDFGRTQPPREDWLSKALPEPAVEPDLPIVDAHMHLWHHASGHRYFVEDYAKDVAASGHRIEASIFIDCNAMYRASGPARLKSVGETEFALGQSAIAASGKYTDTRVAAGIIACADLSSGELVEETIAAHLAAGNGKLRGIRQRAKWDADPVVAAAVSVARPGLYREIEFQEGVRLLASKDLILEASIYHPQIPDVTALAHAVPEATIVVNHSASPLGYAGYRGREREVHRDWLRDMTDLATCPNVMIKLGGLLMTLAAFDFGAAPRPPTSAELADLWRPYIEPCVSLFGPQRCMASSNFPVDKAGFGYGTVWNMFKRITATYSDTEKKAIYEATAARIYRI